MRLTDRLVAAAARRWPPDLAEVMAAEWRAELDVLRAEPGVPPLRRAVRELRFAGSLAVSPPVEDAGAEPVSRPEAWLRSLAVAVGVILLAGGLFNGVHAVLHRAGSVAAAGALAGAAAVMVLAARRSRAGVPARTLAVGAALFGFLLAGNRVAVMPFMGWADVLPAVLVWTGGMALTATLCGGGRRLLAAGLGFATLELAVVAGSGHAAVSLGTGFAAAPAWFPLALLPGGVVTFGPVLPGGVHASEVLLGNASAMAGPMLLATAYVLALMLRPQRARWRPVRRGVDFAVPLGVGAAALALVAAEAVRRVPEVSFGVTAHRLVDNSSLFGFGFLAHTPGRIVLALVAGLLAAQIGAARRA